MSCTKVGSEQDFPYKCNLPTSGLDPLSLEVMTLYQPLPRTGKVTGFLGFNYKKEKMEGTFYISSKAN